MSYLMGIDLGTSSLKTLLINEDGTTQVTAAHEYQFDTPQPGWAQQEPEVWWQACLESIRDVLAQSAVPAEAIAAVSFSGQMHGVVMLDEHGNSVYPAILHCDARSTSQVAELNSRLGHERVASLMRNPIYTGFMLCSLLWMKDNQPEIFGRIRQVCSPKDYIRYKLSEVFSSEHSDASATLLYDIAENHWSDEIIELAGLPREILPRCCESIDPVGRVSDMAAELCGLSTRTLLVSGGGDLFMQSIGNGMIANGDATLNIGSSGQVCFQIDKPIINPQLNTNMFSAYKLGRWVLYGATMSAGLSLKWWRRISGQPGYAQIEEAVAKVKAGSGGLLFLPYLNGERTPHLDPNLSAAFMGINASTGNAEMTRSVMEGVTFSLYQCYEICAKFGFSSEMLLSSGGGARSRVWRQIQADVFNIPNKVAISEEQACLGAAITAGVGAGIFSNMREGCQHLSRYRDDIVEPQAGNVSIYQEFYGMYKEAYAGSHEVLRKLTLTGRAFS